MSQIVLVTQLGRSRRVDGKYRPAVYQFDDGSCSDSITFFGWALQQKIKPDRLVILGTSGSMWDNLFELDLDFGDAFEEERLELQESCLAEKATQAQLDILQQPLAEKLGISEVSLQLIPYCRTEKQQVKLLKTISDQVRENDEVHLDVTHGFRHLPMLGLLSALHLSRVRGITVEKIYYGAMDMTAEGKTPVLDLTGLLKIADWMSALSRYDKDGDYGEFSQLLGEGNEQLKQAAFFERTTNPIKAKEALSGWNSEKGRAENHSPIAQLFLPELERRVQWYKGQDRADWERSLAYEYLEKEDFVRATQYGMEGGISRALKHAGKSLHEYEVRESQRMTLRDQSGEFKKLIRVRNAFSHGVKPSDKDIKNMISDPVTLKATLKSLFKAVLQR